MPQGDGLGVRPFVSTDGGRGLLLLDQRRLPNDVVWVELHTLESVASAIEDLVVRGAPAIGCVAALGLAVATRDFSEDVTEFRRQFVAARERLARTRPTAVNLFVALDQLERALSQAPVTSSPDALRQVLRSAALQHADEDLQSCLAMAEHGAALLPERGTILTHCNAGALATAGYGTALGVIRRAVALGKQLRVVADETRPVLQGARLTAWELMQDGIDVTVIADNMAGALMAQGEIAAAIVGADRIARNGDVANKIGTYTVAVLCHYHRIPFYVAAPWTTVDLGIATGAEIPIEQRDQAEVRCHGGRLQTPEAVAVRNPAFDVTPAELVTAIITERGVFRPGEIAGAGPPIPPRRKDLHKH